MMTACPREFRGVHEGKRVFILASGPSLKSHDLTPLSKRLTIGLNRSILALPAPTYQCCMDHGLFEEYAAGLGNVRCLFTLEDRPWGIPLKLLGTEGWSWDLEQGVYSGYTIAYFALQLAVYLGFGEIYFLGLDLRLQNGDTHFFGTDYRSKDHESTEFPKMHRMLSGASQILRDAGVRVFNCSPIAELPCFPTIAYEKAIAL